MKAAKREAERSLRAKEVQQDQHSQAEAQLQQEITRLTQQAQMLYSEI